MPIVLARMANPYEYNCVLAIADNIYGPYSCRYAAIIGGGHNNFFQDGEGNWWWATMFGNQKGDLLKKSFICRPALVPMRLQDGKFKVKR